MVERRTSVTAILQGEVQQPTLEIDNEGEYADDELPPEVREEIVRAREAGEDPEEEEDEVDLKNIKVPEAGTIDPATQALINLGKPATTPPPATVPTIQEAAAILDVKLPAPAPKAEEHEGKKAEEYEAKKDDEDADNKSKATDLMAQLQASVLAGAPIPQPPVGKERKKPGPKPKAEAAEGEAPVRKKPGPKPKGQAPIESASANMIPKPRAAAVEHTATTPEQELVELLAESQSIRSRLVEINLERQELLGRAQAISGEISGLAQKIASEVTGLDGSTNNGKRKK